MLTEAHSESADVTSNPAVGLGLFMGAAAHVGRDKLTLVVPPALEPLGLWVEQLVAESTGKNGVGVIPIAGETLGPPQVYGADRVFVRLRLAGDSSEAARDQIVRDLAAHAPVATMDVPETACIGAEFVRWEVATAIGGALLGINPFDEPDVQRAKDATRRLLDRYKSDGQLPSPAPDTTTTDGVTMTLTAAARDALRGRSPEAILLSVRRGDYIALLAYLGPDPALAAALRRFRMSARDGTKAATMLGYGPRYLHSTGQLHKGGPNTGVFVLVTAAPVVDIDIPGEAFSFGTLELAQALGDFASLGDAGRRALHVHLPSPDAERLTGVLDSILQARL
jgi:transaldolase/glucose-6-phosphate isomerase